MIKNVFSQHRKEVDRLERTYLASNQQSLDQLQALCESIILLDRQKSFKYVSEYIELAQKQDKKDHVKHAFYIAAKAENYIFNTTKALEYFKFANKYESPDSSLDIKIQMGIAKALINKNDFEEAKLILQRVGQLLNSQHDRELESYYNYVCGFIYMKEYESQFALRKFHEAMVYFEQELDQPNALQIVTLAGIYFSYASIYKSLDIPSKAIPLVKKALNIYEASQVADWIAISLMTLGNCYSIQDKIGKALDCHNKILSLADQIYMQSIVAGTYVNIADILYKKGETDNLFYYYDKSQKYYEAKSDYANIIAILNSKIMVHLDFDNLDAANDLMEELRQYIGKVNTDRQLLVTYSHFSSYYSRHNNFQKAYEFLKTKETLYLSIEEKEKLIQLSELEIKYDVKQKEKEASELRLKSIEMELRALRLQMSPHFIFNGLNSIQQFIVYEENEKAQRFLAKFSRLMRRSLEQSRVEFISIQEEIQFITDYLYLEQLRFNNQLDFEIFFDKKLEKSDFAIPPMLVQPFIENAIKHGLQNSKSGIIKVRYEYQNNETLICSIEDNGIGRNAASKKIPNNQQLALGNILTLERLKHLHGKDVQDDALLINVIDLSSSEGKPLGTRIEVKIPIRKGF